MVVSGFSLHILLRHIAALVYLGVLKLICFLCLFGIDEFDLQVIVHLFDFIIRIYDDARSPDRQMHYFDYLFIMEYISAYCEVGDVTYLSLTYTTRREGGPAMCT